MREVKVLDLGLQLTRRRPSRALLVLPYRLVLDAQGYYDQQNRGRRFQISKFLAPSDDPTADAIQALEDDASYFWPVAEVHWRKLSEHTGLPAKALKAAVFRSGDS